MAAGIHSQAGSETVMVDIAQRWKHRRLEKEFPEPADLHLQRPRCAGPFCSSFPPVFFQRRGRSRQRRGLQAGSLEQSFAGRREEKR